MKTYSHQTAAKKLEWMVVRQNIESFSQPSLLTPCAKESYGIEIRSHSELQDVLKTAMTFISTFEVCAKLELRNYDSMKPPFQLNTLL